jgi:hypothetical protein
MSEQMRADGFSAGPQELVCTLPFEQLKRIREALDVAESLASEVLAAHQSKGVTTRRERQIESLILSERVSITEALRKLRETFPNL